MPRRQHHHQRQAAFGSGRLRIQAGQWRGRHIETLPDRRVRPMIDRVREALFNALATRGWLADGTHVLDVFAGTGILALEALSRGAGHATLIERDPEIYRRLRESVQSLGVEPDRIELIHGDAFEEAPRRLQPWLTRPQANTEPAAPQSVLVLLDPPYANLRPPEATEFLAKLNDLLEYLTPPSTNEPRPAILYVVGHEKDTELPDNLASHPKAEMRRYGRACLTFYGNWPQRETETEPGNT